VAGQTWTLASRRRRCAAADSAPASGLSSSDLVRQRSFVVRSQTCVLMSSSERCPNPGGGPLSLKEPGGGRSRPNVRRGEAACVMRAQGPAPPGGAACPRLSANWLPQQVVLEATRRQLRLSPAPALPHGWRKQFPLRRTRGGGRARARPQPIADGLSGRAARFPTAGPAARSS